MKLTLSMAAYWISGLFIDIVFGLKLKDFYLPADYIQQIEIEMISHVLIIILWGAGGIIWLRIAGKYLKRKDKQ